MSCHGVSVQLDVGWRTTGMLRFFFQAIITVFDVAILGKWQIRPTAEPIYGPLLLFVCVKHA